MKKILLIFIIVLFNIAHLYSQTIEEDFLFYTLIGDAKKVLYYINKEKVDINLKNEDGLTPLMLSIMANQNEITEILIRKGANLELKDNEGKTALLWAISKDNIEAVRMLIDAWVDFDIKSEIAIEEDVYCKKYDGFNMVCW